MTDAAQDLVLLELHLARNDELVRALVLRVCLGERGFEALVGRRLRILNASPNFLATCPALAALGAAGGARLFDPTDTADVTVVGLSGPGLDTPRGRVAGLVVEHADGQRQKIFWSQLVADLGEPPVISPGVSIST